MTPEQADIVTRKIIAFVDTIRGIMPQIVVARLRLDNANVVRFSLDVDTPSAEFAKIAADTIRQIDQHLAEKCGPDMAKDGCYTKAEATHVGATLRYAVEAGVAS